MHDNLYSYDNHKLSTQRRNLLFMMTGRSESAIDDDEDGLTSGLAKSKAINSSYINLKRNNLLT